MKNGLWYERSYRRNLVDMHIEDWDERFLSQFDPIKYVEMLRIANIRSAMIYANSHVGHCYWPTSTGHMHRGLGGRDTLGEILRLCHEGGIDAIIYYSLIYNNWAYEKHPDWRILDIDGRSSREKGGRGARYGVCCPNSPGYRKFVCDQIGELCQNYDFEGIFFDMTFWPSVCYCPNCRTRYGSEVEGDIPEIIDWGKRPWCDFQRKREGWLSEFAAMATSAVRKYKPEVTVEHQCSTVASSWQLGVTSTLAEQCDYVGGDFYGGILQQSFICKLYYNLTPNMPFEFMTSICHPGLSDHTTSKPRELIEARALLALAHGGAFLMIDAIDPIGTIDERKYRMVGDIFEETGRYEDYVGGELCQDVAIYFSFDSKVDFSANGKKVSDGAWDSNLPHVEASLGAAEALRSNHIPFGVISKRNLKSLANHKVVILPNVLRLGDEEAEAIGKYISSGGNVYASKFTIASKLSDILGITVIGETKEKFTYLAPTSKGMELLPEITEEYPLSVQDSQIEAKASPGDEILATITLPYTDPDDPARLASIHSDPPGVATKLPAIIEKGYGRGRIVWSAAPIERFTIQSLKHRSIFANVIRSLAPNPFCFEADAPGCVEIVQFSKPAEMRYLVSVLNLQSEIGMPNIPVTGVILRVRVEGKPLKAVSLPDEIPLPFIRNGDYLSIEVPSIKAFHMLAIDYRI